MPPYYLSKCLVSLFNLCFILSHLPLPPQNLQNTPGHPPPLTLIQPQKRQQTLFSIPYSSLVLSPPSPLSSTSFNIRKSLVRNLKLHSNSSSWLFTLLIISGDVELNPGPTSAKYPCGVCSRPCKNNQPAIQCDSCDTWIHKKCIQITPKNWKILKNTSISWHCLNCALPNFSSTLFDDFNPTNLSQNPFFLLSPPAGSQSQFAPTAQIAPSPCAADPECAHPAAHCTPPQPPSPLPSLPLTPPPQAADPECALPAAHCTLLQPPSPLPPFRPNGASTPQKTTHHSPNKCAETTPQGHLPPPPNSTVTNLVINFQSLKNKIHTFSTLVSDSNPDIIYGTETWLHHQIKDPELELGDYDLYRNERPGNSNPNYNVDTNTLTEKDKLKKKIGGGVLLAIKKTLNSELVLNSSNTEAIYCKIAQKDSPPLIVGCVYRPPDNDLSICKLITREILDITVKPRYNAPVTTPTPLNARFLRCTVFSPYINHLKIPLECHRHSPSILGVHTILL